jgi:hypothetical protein
MRQATQKPGCFAALRVGAGDGGPSQRKEKTEEAEMPRSFRDSRFPPIDELPPLKKGD